MKIKEKEFESLLQDLKSLANQMGATVRFERGDFKGGYCILKESKVIVINKLANLQRKVTTLAAALNELGIDKVFLTPKLREIIEETENKKEEEDKNSDEVSPAENEEGKADPLINDEQKTDTE
ncbi:MAG: hypothetical protein KKA84_00325 [Bacteroidetes bacterium]|nr:hypothetical protein [Bacteroidota bacterium]